MRQADALTKEYLSNNEIFADVFNYLIYDGQQRILPDNLIERDTSEYPIFVTLSLRVEYSPTALNTCSQAINMDSPHLASAFGIRTCKKFPYFSPILPKTKMKIRQSLYI